MTLVSGLPNSLKLTNSCHKTARSNVFSNIEDSVKGYCFSHEGNHKNYIASTRC